MAAKIPIMAITIINSISVKPLSPLKFLNMLYPPLLIVVDRFVIFFHLNTASYYMVVIASFHLCV